MVMPAIAVDTVDELIAAGIARGGMSAKLQAARRALAAGVSTVRISDTTALVDPATGTRLTTAHSPA
jgi:acetylglutamate kinase